MLTFVAKNYMSFTVRTKILSMDDEAKKKYLDSPDVVFKSKTQLNEAEYGEQSGFQLPSYHGESLNPSPPSQPLGPLRGVAIGPLRDVGISPWQLPFSSPC